MRKLRPDSKLGNLPEAQRDQFVKWLLDRGMSYVQARKRVLATFGVSTTTYALSKFYARFCEPLRAQYRETARLGRVRGHDAIFEEQLRQDKEREKRG